MTGGETEPHDHTAAMRAIWREMRAQGAKQDKMLALMTKDPLDLLAPPGIKQIQEDHTRRIDDVKTRVANLETQHEANLTKINATRDETDAMRTEHTWTMAWDGLKMCMAAAVGALTAALTTRPPHP
jgi:hypothetical protein